MEKVNPRDFSKSGFRASERKRVDEDAIRESLEGIFESIEHLHSLVFLHNDINPANIAFDEDDTPVLIDFGSRRRIGESLCGTNTKKTHQWHGPNVDTVMEENNLDAFEELRTWLVGAVDDEFLFK